MMKAQRNKTRIALMTYAIDGRQASGSALVARKNVEALLARQDAFDVTFIHYEKSDDPIYSHGVREVILPTFGVRFLNRRSLRQIYYFLTTTDTFDIVQWFQPRLYPFFWLAPARYKIVTAHGAGDVKKENPFIFSRHVFNWTMRLFRKKIAVAIAGSDYSRKDIIQAYRLDPAQVHVINNGVDARFVPASVEEVRAVRQKYNLPEQFFLGVARLIPNKNVIRMFRAFDLFSRAQGMRDIQFVNIGARGSERPSIDRLIDASTFKDRFHLIEYVEEADLPAMYSAAFALVFPILNEGFGLPAVESMACGTPTIISKTAAPELADDVALLVDVLSEEDIARAMGSLANDSALHDRLAKRGRDKAHTLTWRASGDTIVKMYEELMSRNG